MTSETPLVDEGFYLGAFEAVLGGGSPYDAPSYFYPPVFASWGASLLQQLGQAGTLAAFRALNVLGVAALTWWSLSLLRLGRTATVLTALAFVAVAPGVALGMHSGNLSPAISAAIVGALLFWKQRPALTGFLLALSVAIKPVGAIAAPLIGLHRGAGRRGFVAAAVAVVLATAMLAVAVGFVPQFLAIGSELDPEAFPMERTASLHRLLYNLGLDVHRLVVFAIVGLGTLVAVRMRPWARLDLACLILAAIVLVTPALWSHTLLVTLPLQAIALRLAWSRRDGARWYELVLVVVGILAIQLSDGVGGVGPGPSLAVAAALAPPVLAPTALALWILRSKRS